MPTWKRPSRLIRTRLSAPTGLSTTTWLRWPTWVRPGWRRPTAVTAALAAGLAAILGVSVLAGPEATAEPGKQAPAAKANRCNPGISGPNDPEYAQAERSPLSGKTFNAEQWYLYDCMPLSAPLAKDTEGVAGMSVNRSWAEHGRGRPDVRVAYLEGGVNWRLEQSRELRRRAYLNTGELPKPRRADGSESPEYDLDGDGEVTVDDWKDDPRIHRPLLHEKTAGGITPEDLIVAFSDGSDADGNGYADDISGWNFHRDTNDPQTDQSIYAHANGESANVLGEADNGYAGTGMCPKCRLLSVKIADEAVVRPDRIAEGVVFAVDSGVKVIVAVVAGLGQTPSMRAALEYAHAKGVVVVWASNDFDSADHTEGMRYPHVWPGNGVTSDRSNRGGSSRPTDLTATTFRSRSTLTSFGPHNLFSVGSTDGSTSQSTPILGGVAALVVAAGMTAADDGTLNEPLSPDEVKQVVRAATSPITGNPCAPHCFPGEGGSDWNLQYGYGRPNVHKAVSAVHAGEIPPTTEFETPDWYAAVDPTTQSSVDVKAKVGAPRADGYTWELQYGLGPQPADDAWQTFAEGDGRNPGTANGTLDLSRIPESFWAGAYEAPTKDRLAIERYDVTLRVQIRDDKGRLGEDRRVFHLRHEPSQVTELAKNLDTSSESPPVFADLEGRGKPNLVVAGADGTVHAYRADGDEAPGWPVRTKPARGVDPDHPVNYLHTPAWSSGDVPLPSEPVIAPIAVADLDGDGGQDVVVTGADGYLYVWDGAGKMRPGFPVTMDRSTESQSVPVPDTPYVRNATTGSFGGAAVGDMDGDRKLEIVQNGWDGKVYAWRADGSQLPGWPASTEIAPEHQKPPGADVFARDFKVVATPTLVDVDGDGRKDVISALNSSAFGSGGAPAHGFVIGWSSDGRVLPHFPLSLPAATQGYGTAQDFVTEGAVTPVVYETASGPKMVAAANLSIAETIDLRTGHRTVEVPGALAPIGGPNVLPAPMVHFSTAASIGKLGGSDRPYAVQGGSGSTDIAVGLGDAPGVGIRIRNGLSAWNPDNGLPVPKHTHDVQGLPFISAPAIADVSGDGRPDIVSGGDSGALHAWDGETGDPVPDFPRWTGGWTVTTPSVGDLDGDGKSELAIGTREGRLLVFHTEGKADATEAWHWHQNERNTGLYGEDTRPPGLVTGIEVADQRDGVELTFTAPGDDGGVGTVRTYEVLSVPAGGSSDLSKAQVVTVKAEPVAAGRKQTIQLRGPAAAGVLLVRAVDEAGNVGPVRRPEG
jgi:hypothetical protein